MRPTIYFPTDEFGGDQVDDNVDLAADYLELCAIFSKSASTSSRDIIAAAERSAESDFPNVNDEFTRWEEIANAAVNRMYYRQQALDTSYPFKINDASNEISFIVETPFCLGQVAYLLSLILSNLEAVTPLMSGFKNSPSAKEERNFRRYFQSFATAAVAAEVGGPAWSFGFPREDGTSFINKLTSIWQVLNDGHVQPRSYAPRHAKDDQIDIFAWRKQYDKLPGFLLVAAQVATGTTWRDKSIKAHVNKVFQERWFNPPPTTEIIPYHVIPFARPDEEFHEDIRICGNVLHRLRVPRRVQEAVALNDRDDIEIEGFELLPEAAKSIMSYVESARAP